MRKTQFLQRIAAGALAGLLAFTGLPVSALAAASPEGGEEPAEAVFLEEADEPNIEEAGEAVSEALGEGTEADLSGASEEGEAVGEEEAGEAVSEVPGEGAKEDFAGAGEETVEIAGGEEKPVPDLAEEEEGSSAEAPEEAGEGSEEAAGEVYSVDITPKNRSVSLTAQTDDLDAYDTWLVYTTGSLSGMTSASTSWDDDGFDLHSGTGFEIYSFNAGNSRIYAQNDENGAADWDSANGNYHFAADYVNLEPETTYSYALAKKTESYDSSSYRTVYTFSFLTTPQRFTTLADPETTSVEIRDFKAESTGYNDIRVGFALTNPNGEAIESPMLYYKLEGETEYEEMTLGLSEGRYSGSIPTGGKKLTVYPSVKVTLKSGARTITLPEQTFSPADKSNIAKSLEKKVNAGAGSVSLDVNIAFPNEDDYLYAYLVYKKKGTESWQYSGTFAGGFSAVHDADYEPTGRGRASMLVSGLEEGTEYEYRIEIYAGYRDAADDAADNLLYTSKNETIITKTNVIHTAADFPDALFLEKVKAASQNANRNLSGDALLSDTALEKVTSLSIYGRSEDTSYIQDITGIEFLPNLTSLNIQGQDVSKGASKLSGLTSLTSLYLEYNDLAELPDLTALSALTSLDLEGNLISASAADVAAKLPERLKDRASDIVYRQRKAPVLTLAKDATYYPIFRARASAIQHNYPFLAKVSGLKSSYRTYTLELTIDGETLRSEPTSDTYSPFFIPDVGLYGAVDDARIRLVDHTGHVYVDQENVRLIFEEDECFSAVIHASAGASSVRAEGYISGSYRKSDISELTLISGTGESVGMNTYLYTSTQTSDPRYRGVFDSMPSALQVECTRIYADFDLYKAIPAGEYSAQCKVNGQTMQFATVIIGNDQVVTDVYLASSNYSRSDNGGYDNRGETVSIRVSGINLKMADAVPSLKLDGKTVTESGYTAAIPYGTDGFIYTLKKASGWADASTYDVAFSDKIVDESNGTLYYGSSSFEPIRAQYYNWKLNPRKYEVHLKESAGIPVETPVKVTLYTNSGYSTIKASAESTVESGGVIYFTFMDPTGQTFEPVRNSTAYLRYEFGGEVNRTADTSDRVYWYNYYDSGSGGGGEEESDNPYFTDIDYYHYVPLKALSFSLYVPTDQLTGEEIRVSLRGTNSSTALSDGTVSGKYTVYKGSLNTEALAEGVYTLEARQGDVLLTSINDNIFLLEKGKFYMHGQHGSIYPDELYTYISSPALYKLYKDDYSSKRTPAQALEYAKANFLYTVYDGTGKKLGEFAPTSASWSGWNLYTYFNNIPDLGDYFSLWVKVTDKNSTPGYDLTRKMSYYAANANSTYCSEEYGYLCTSGAGLYIEEGDAKVYQEVYIGRAALPATAYFTEINRADVISSFTISKATSGSYYLLTASDVSKIKADHAYSLHILSADGMNFDSDTGYFAAASAKTTKVSSVKITGTAYVPVGKTTQLSAVISPAGASVGAISWTSDHPEIAAVSGDGLVTGVSVGTAKITVTADGKTNTLSITVHDYAIAKDGTKVTEGLTMNLADEGVTLQLLNGTTPVLNGITWSSANESVAVVDKAGKVSPRGKGETTITAQTKTGSASVKLTVTAGLTGITLSKSEGAVAFEQGDAIKLSYTLNPKGAEAVSITAALSSDEKLAEITINQTARTISIQALKTGSDDIVIKAVDKEGKEVSAVFKLTVVEPVDLSWVENALAPTAYIFATTAKTLGEEIPLSLLNENKNNPGYRFEWEDPDIDLSSYAGSSIGRFMLKYTIPAQKEGYPDYQRSLSISRKFISLGGIRLLVKAEAQEENEEKALNAGDTVAPGTVLKAELVPVLEGDENGYYAAGAIDDGGAENAEEALEDLLKTCSYAWKGKGETGTTASFAPKNAGALNLTGTITLGKIKYTDTFKCNVSGAGIGEITVGAPFTDAENSEGDQYYLAALDSLKVLSTPPLMQVKVSEAKKFTAVSSDPKVLKIKAGTAADEKYPVTLEALAEGTAYVTLTVTDKDGGTLSERVKFVITNPDANLSAASLTLNWKNRAGTSFAILPNEGYEVYDAAIGRDDMSLERQSFRTEDEAGNLKENPTDQFRLHPYKNVDGTVKALNTKGTLKNVTLTIRLIPEGQSVTDESNITAIEKTLTIKVEEKNPVVKVAQTAAVNQYYQYDSEYSAGALRITTAESLEAAELSGGDFSITDDEENTSEKSGLYAYQVFAVKNDASQKSTTLKMTFPDYQDKDGKDLVLESKLTVKTAVSAPKYKLAASSVTLYPAAGISEADAEVIMASGRRVGFAVVSADAGKTGIEVDTSAEPIRVSAPASAKGGSVKLTLTPEEMNTANTKAKPVTLNLSVKVNAKTPTLALGAKTIVLNGHEELWENARAAASVQISGAPGAAIDPAALSIAAAKSTDQKSVDALKYMDTSFAEGRLYLSLREGISANGLKKGTYKFMVSYALSDTAKAQGALTVNVVDTAPAKAITLKAGRTTIDLLRRDADNYYAGFTARLSAAQGKVVDAHVLGAAAGKFYAEVNDGTGEIQIRAVAGVAISTKIKYVLPLRLTLETEDGVNTDVRGISVQIRPAQSKAAFSFSPASFVTFPSAKESFSVDLKAMIPNMSTPLTVEKVVLLKGGEDFSVDYYSDPDAGKSGVLTFSRLPGARKGKTSKLTFAVYCEDAGVDSPSQTAAYSIRVK